MLGIVINALAIIAGGVLGLFLKKGISEKQVKSLLIIVNLTIAIMGIQGAVATKNMTLMILSIVFGSIVGVWLNIDGRINQFAGFLKSKLKSNNPDFVKGFITAFMIQCIGALAIVGPLNAGLKGDFTVLYFKSILDFISSLIFASIYGSGVFLSAGGVFFYEGFIFLVSKFIQSFLSKEVVNEISSVGSLLILALSFDLLEIKKIKVANYLPAVIFPIIYYAIIDLF